MKIISFEDHCRDKNLEKPPFEVFYREYYLRILNYIHSKLGNRTEAEDLTSEIFVYCYEHYDAFDPLKSSLTTWIFLIAGCRLKNYYRDKKENVDYSELEEYLFVEDKDMERAVYLMQLRKHIAKVLEQLPEKQRDIIISRYFKETSFEEIAMKYNTTPGNIRTILSRTLDRIQSNFELY